MAQQASIADFQKLSKASLFKKLQDQFDLDRLIRAETRRSKFLSDGKKRKPDSKEDVSAEQDEGMKNIPKKKMKLNTTDPIMFSKIEKKNVFTFTRPNGTMIRFNIESLVDYLLVSGDFTDPETRLPFSDDDLREIDETVSHTSLSFHSHLSLTFETLFLFSLILSGGEGFSEEGFRAGCQEKHQCLH